MKTCPQCNKEYEDAGGPCPHCPPEKSSTSKKFKLTRTTEGFSEHGVQSGKGKMVTFNLSPKLVGIIIAVVVVTGLVAGLFSESDDNTSASSSSGQTPAAVSKTTFSMDESSKPNKAPAKAMSVADEVNAVFTGVSRANLEENIDEFMKYYAAGFPERSGKQQKTIETWKTYDFMSLDFFVFDLDIQGARANASVGWEIALLEKGAKQPRLIETTNEVVLEKGEQGWQIVSLQ